MAALAVAKSSIKEAPDVCIFAEARLGALERWHFLFYFIFFTTYSLINIPNLLYAYAAYVSRAVPAAPTKACYGLIRWLIVAAWCCPYGRMLLGDANVDSMIGENGENGPPAARSSAG